MLGSHYHNTGTDFCPPKCATCCPSTVGESIRFLCVSENVTRANPSARIGHYSDDLCAGVLKWSDMFASTLQCLGRECMWHPDPWHCKGEQCTWLSGGPTCCREILLKSPIIFRNLRVNCFCQLMFALFFFFGKFMLFPQDIAVAISPQGMLTTFYKRHKWNGLAQSWSLHKLFLSFYRGVGSANISFD